MLHNETTERILSERFGTDSLIALATVSEGLPYVRTVNAVYLGGAFAAWYDNGHTNEADPNTCLLKITLTQGVLFSHGARYDITF